MPNPLEQLSPDERAALREAINARLQSGRVQGNQQARAAKALQMLAEIDQPAEMFPTNPADTIDAGTRAVMGLGQSLKGLFYDAPKGVMEAGQPDPEHPIASAFMGPGQVIKRLFVDPSVTSAKSAYDSAQLGDTLGAVADAARAVPVLGPMGASYGEQLGSGDVAGGLTRAIADVAIPAGAMKTVKAAAPYLKGVTKPPTTVRADFAAEALRRLDAVSNMSEANALSVYGPKPTTAPNIPWITNRLNKILAAEDLPAVPPHIKKALDTLNEAQLKGIADVDTLRASRDYISKEMLGQKLPNNVYRATRDARNALTTGIRRLYEAEERLPDFQAGEKAWAQHSRIVYSKNSPFKKAFDARDTLTGAIDSRKVLKALSSDDPSAPIATHIKKMEAIGGTQVANLSNEALQLEHAIRRWEGLNAYTSQPARLAAIQKPLGYAMSRPGRFPSLREPSPIAPAATLTGVKDAATQLENFMRGQLDPESRGPYADPLDAMFQQVREGTMSSEVPKAAVRVAQSRVGKDTSLERLIASAPPAPEEFVSPPITPKFDSRPILNYERRPFEIAPELAGPSGPPPNPLEELLKPLADRSPAPTAFSLMDRRNVQPQPGDINTLTQTPTPILNWLGGERPPLESPMTTLFQPRQPQMQLPASPGFVRGAENAAEVPRDYFTPTEGEATATPRTTQQYKMLMDLLRFRNYNR